MDETYYEILGVPKDAPDREIKRAYHALARRFHPDISGETGAEDRFKRINEAYRVLSNREERSRYDALGHDGYRRSPPGCRDSPAPPGPVDFRGFGDAFDLFFSERWGPAGRFRPKPLSDILVRLEVTLEEAVLGGERAIEVPYAARCRSCGGTGSMTGVFRPCPRCGGSGAEGAGASPGFVDPGSAPCRECGGRRRVPEAPCGQCGGWGATQAVRRVTVRIPPGIDSGMRIRKEGLGKEGDAEIPSGDLYVEVAVRPHERFARKGDDLETPVHISPARAALGSSTELPTIDGRTVRVEIPAGIQHEAAVRVRGEGVKTRERCGDLVARIRIDNPSQVTGEEQALYRQILRIEERREEAKKGGLLSRALSRMRDTGK